MSEINLCKMTKSLARIYYRDFQNDPVMFTDPAKFQPYVYSPERSDACVDRYASLGREFLAVMLDGRPIGEVVLKNFDREAKSCTLGIHLQNDAVKDCGYGTAAEILALEYAFGTLGMETVYADALSRNARSQHVLKKVGFVKTHTDDAFHYYRCDRSGWHSPRLGQIPKEPLEEASAVAP